MDFKHRFIGREPELTQLIDSWELTRSGRPQFVLLLGDSGLGKTRLIHEFYRRLSRHENRPDGGPGYWPDLLDDDVVSLRVNPDLSRTPVSGVEMPWLWWGLRWQQAGGRNASGRNSCALTDQDAQQALAPHREFHRLTKARGEHRMKMLTETLTLAAETTPGVSEIWGAADRGRKVLGVALEGFNLWHTDPRARVDATSVWTRCVREAAVEIREFLVAVLGPEDGTAPRPVILVLDDAQWADATTLAFVRDLFADAVTHGWPLLVLCTCWETAWKEQLSGSGTSLLRHDPVHLGQLIAQLRLRLASSDLSFLDAPHGTKITLQRFSRAGDLRPLLTTAFPGLGPDAQGYLLDLAGGNPRVLVELLLQLHEQATSDWFVEGRTNADLTPDGFARLKSLPSTYEGVIASRVRRLDAADRAVFDALAVATPQGMRFHGSLVAAVAERVKCLSAAEVMAALDRAQTPHNFISLFPGTTRPAEFKERFAWTSLVSACDRRWPAARTHLRETLLHWLDQAELDAEPAAPDFLDSLVSLLSAPDAPPDAAARLVPVLGDLVGALVSQQRMAEAADRAVQLWEHVGRDPGALFVQVRVQRCLALVVALAAGRHFKTAVQIATKGLAERVVDDAARVDWLELQARSQHADETFAAAAETWANAIAIAKRRKLPDALLIARLELGEAGSRHAAHGALAAVPFYERALAGLDQSGRQGEPAGQIVHGELLQGLAVALCEAGRLNDAVGVMGEAARCFARCESQFGAQTGILEARVSCLNRLGEWYLHEICGKPADAIECLRQALALEQELARRMGESSEALRKQAVTATWLARALGRNAEWDEAFSVVERALGLRVEIARRIGERVDTWRGTALVHYCRGELWLGRKDAERGRSDFEAARVLRQRVVDHEVNRWDEQVRRDVRHLGYTHRKLGETEFSLGDAAAARRHLKRALALNQNLRKPTAAPIDLREAYKCWEELGKVAARQNRRGLAIRSYRRALAWLTALGNVSALAVVSARDQTRLEAELLALTRGVESDRKAGRTGA